MPDTLQNLRDAIESVDEELTALLVRRMRLALRVAAVKSRHNLPVLDSQREAQVLKRITRYEHAPMTVQEMETLYSSIMKISRCVQHRALETAAPEPAGRQAPDNSGQKI